MPLRTEPPIGERNLRYNPRSRAEWDRLRQTGVIVSVFASNCRGLSTASLEDAIVRVTGKPGRVYEHKTNPDLRELRLTTPKCVEAMLFEHPFIVAMFAGVSRSVRIVRWVSNTGQVKPWISSEQPDVPERSKATAAWSARRQSPMTS